MATTLSDLAREAGVSIATASRAVNGIRGVRSATSRRVNDVAQRLGYRPAHPTRPVAILHYSGSAHDAAILRELIGAVGPGGKVLVCPVPGEGGGLPPSARLLRRST